MKILSKSKRSTVRSLVNRAIADIKTAKDMTFKAYGSKQTSDDLTTAIILLEMSLKNLKRTKYSESNPKAVHSADCKTKCNPCPMQEKKEPKKFSGAEVEERFKNLVVEQLLVKSEECVPSAKLVIGGLFTDDLDKDELVMAIEDEFSIAICGDALDDCETYGDLLELVKRKFKEKEAK